MNTHTSLHEYLSRLLLTKAAPNTHAGHVNTHTSPFSTTGPTSGRCAASRRRRLPEAREPFGVITVQRALGVSLLPTARLEIPLELPDGALLSYDVRTADVLDIHFRVVVCGPSGDRVVDNGSRPYHTGALDLGPARRCIVQLDNPSWLRRKLVSYELVVAGRELLASAAQESLALRGYDESEPGPKPEPKVLEQLHKLHHHRFHHRRHHFHPHHHHRRRPNQQGSFHDDDAAGKHPVAEVSAVSTPEERHHARQLTSRINALHAVVHGHPKARGRGVRFVVTEEVVCFSAPGNVKQMWRAARLDDGQPSRVAAMAMAHKGNAFPLQLQPQPKSQPQPQAQDVEEAQAAVSGQPCGASPTPIPIPSLIPSALAERNSKEEADEEAVDLVVLRTGVGRDVAQRLLATNHNDVIAAILSVLSD